VWKSQLLGNVSVVLGPRFNYGFICDEFALLSEGYDCADPASPCRLLKSLFHLSGQRIQSDLFLHLGDIALLINRDGLPVSVDCKFGPVKSPAVFHLRGKPADRRAFALRRNGLFDGGRQFFAFDFFSLALGRLTAPPTR